MCDVRYVITIDSTSFIDKLPELSISELNTTSIFLSFVTVLEVASLILDRCSFRCTAASPAEATTASAAPAPVPCLSKFFAAQVACSTGSE